MTEKLETALNNVEMTYGELVEIATDMVKTKFEPINEIINNISEHVNAMPIDIIRDSILLLQLKAFEISEIKEKSVMKAELAEALQKEKFAIQFNSFDGTAAAKDKLAQIATSEETTAEILYNLVSGLFKNKVEQLHRLVDCLKSILMSRMQETKFMNISIGEKNERTYLAE